MTQQDSHLIICVRVYCCNHLAIAAAAVVVVVVIKVMIMSRCCSGTLHKVINTSETFDIKLTVLYNELSTQCLLKLDPYNNVFTHLTIMESYNIKSVV